VRSPETSHSTRLRKSIKELRSADKRSACLVGFAMLEDTFVAIEAADDQSLLSSTPGD